MALARRPGPEALHGSSSPSERLPIIEHVPVRFGADDRARIERHAARLRLQEPGLAATAAFGRGVRPGVGAGPWLHIHDTSSLRITGRSHASPLEYRAFALAGAGDIVALHVPRDTAFEAYCRDVLGFGELEVLRAATAGPNASLAMRCVRDPWVLDRLVARAEEAGGLTVHPYLGSGGVWALAGRIAARSGDRVLVAAPPPRLAPRVNNKIWFTQRAEELLGPRSVPSSRETYSLAILAGAVRDLARDHDRIGIKLPIAAGGAGNVVIDTASLRELPLTVIRDRLARLLARAAWGDPFPLLVSVWESPVVLSPSVQLWIPHAVDGPPIVEGIFEQRSSGLIGRFIGAVPAELPGALRERIAAEAALIGLLFQQLGYFGRCSFDAILVGERLEDAELHWVECNGRWGGTSIPMTLVNRLTGDWATAPFVIAHPEGCPRLPFAEVLDRTADLLFRPGARSTGVVYLSPGGFDPEGGLKYLVIARDPGGAQREADEVVARLRA